MNLSLAPFDEEVEPPKPQMKAVPVTVKAVPPSGITECNYIIIVLIIAILLLTQTSM